MANNKIRRMYRAAACRRIDDEFAILLDDRPAMTPGKKTLSVPSLALGRAVAEEWNTQEEWIVPFSMPLTQIANTALDRIAGRRQTIVSEVVRYVEDELVCYRAEPESDLARREEMLWQPILDWLAERYDVQLITTAGLIHVEQPSDALKKLTVVLSRMSVAELTVLQCAVAASGSLVLALALVVGRVDGADLFELSQLEETWQIERWGEDEETTLRRRALRQDALVVAHYLDLVRQQC